MKMPQALYLHSLPKRVLYALRAPEIRSLSRFKLIYVRRHHHHHMTHWSNSHFHAYMDTILLEQQWPNFSDCRSLLKNGASARHQFSTINQIKFTFVLD